jgi:hypothetical protein
VRDPDIARAQSTPQGPQCTELIVGVCLEYVYMPCMAYTRLSQVPDYAK